MIVAHQSHALKLPTGKMAHPAEAYPLVSKRTREAAGWGLSMMPLLCSWPWTEKRHHTFSWPRRSSWWPRLFKVRFSRMNRRDFGSRLLHRHPPADPAETAIQSRLPPSSQPHFQCGPGEAEGKNGAKTRRVFLGASLSHPASSPWRPAEWRDQQSRLYRAARSRYISAPTSRLARMVSAYGVSHTSRNPIW
jgi:hypothetical protein